MPDMELSKKVNNRSWWKKGIDLFTRSKTPVPTLILLYLIMLLIFSLSSEYYLTAVNTKSILNQFAILGILSAGVTVVMIGGGFDLSIGSMVGFIGTITAVLLTQDNPLPIPVIIIISLLMGCSIGFINGIIITKVGINPIITTLGTMVIIRGVGYFWAEFNNLIYDESWLTIGRGFIGDIVPYTLVYIIIFFIILSIVLKFSKFGRDLYTIGGNEDIARIAGIKIDNVKILSYVISGLFAAIAAIVLTSQLSTGRQEFGQGAELEVLTIVVLGGVAVGGGKGNYLGVFIALLIIGSLSNGLVLMDVPIYVRMVIKGSLLILAISMDAFRGNRRIQVY